MQEAVGSGSNRDPIFGIDKTRFDEKGRLVIAKPLRDWLAGPFTVVYGEISGLCIYPNDTWETLKAWVLALPSNYEGRQMYRDLFLRNVQPNIACDSQGRVVISQDLRELADIKTEVIVVGSEDHIEIWDKDQYFSSQKNPTSINQERKSAVLESKRMVEAWYAANQPQA